MKKLYGIGAYLCGSMAIAMLMIGLMAASGSRAWGEEVIIENPIEDTPALGTCDSEASTPCLADDYCPDPTGGNQSCRWQAYLYRCCCPSSVSCP